MSLKNVVTMEPYVTLDLDFMIRGKARAKENIYKIVSLVSGLVVTPEVRVLVRHERNQRT